MVVKFLSKYILEVIPSIVATVVGAYIVTHYINTKSDTDKPKAEIAAPAVPAKTDESAKSVETPAAMPAKAEAAKTDQEPAAKSVEKSSETASAPVEQRRVFRPKPAGASPAESAKVEDTRDANEIAREAIARLRNSEQPPTAETPRVQQTPRLQERASVGVTYAPAPVQMQTPAVQTLPPATTVAPPLNEVTVIPAPQPPVVRVDAPPRFAPPADIPSRPLELHAKERTSVAEEVVSTAKSVFQAVIPGTN